MRYVDGADLNGWMRPNQNGRPGTELGVEMNVTRANARALDDSLEAWSGIEPLYAALQAAA